MSKIAFEVKKGRMIVSNRLSYPESVNERIYNAIAAGMFEGFLPLSLRQTRKETVIDCMVHGMIPLNQYFGGLVTKKMFLDFAHELAQIIKNCEKNMANPNNLDLHSDRIFIHPKTKRVACIFWPVVNNQRDNPPQVFLKQLPQEINFSPHEDSEYVSTYKRFFSGTTPFSINNFDRMVMRLMGQSTTGHNAPSETLVTPSGATGRTETAGNEIVNIEYDPFSENVQAKPEEKTADASAAQPAGERIFCGECGKPNQGVSNFCIYCGTKLRKRKAEVSVEPPEINPEATPDSIVPEPPESDATVTNEEPDLRLTPPEPIPFEGTTVLGENLGGTMVIGVEENTVFRPYLKRVKNEEIIYIDKPVFVIGAEAGKCDLVISDNKFISRKHAEIITKEERYYIIDRRSTNKTYVDRKVIPAGQEMELFHGTEIRFANEDFVFSIES